MRNTKGSAIVARYGMPLVLLALIAVLQVSNPDAGLLQWQNLKTILLQTSVLGFLSLGLSFVMIAGESDISYAGTLGMMSATFTMLVNSGVPYLPALAAIILIGMAIGLVIALLVTKCGFSAFIISIAFMFMGLGVERSFNEGITIWMKSESVLAIGKLEFAGMYALSWFMFVLFALAHFIVRYTRYGFQLRIIGENVQAGNEAGVKAPTVRVIAFLIAGAMFGVASTIEPIRMGGSIVGAGQSYMLPALAACYLGSTMFTPGRVNVLGTLIGALFMTVITNFMQLLSLPYYFPPLVQGSVLLVAVGISVFRSRDTIQQCKI